MSADDAKPARAAEVHALARRIEARARRTRDKDLARVSALLRVLLSMMTDTGGIAAPLDRCQTVGRALH
jgi:hypothetical protein